MNNLPFKRVEGGLLLAVHLTPKSAKDMLGEIVDGAAGVELKVKVRAVPDKGKANQALVKLLGKQFRWPKSSIEVIKGQQSRHKIVKIYGEFSEIEPRVKTTLNSGENR